MLNIISSSILSSIYFLKVKIGEWKKRKARWKHAPFVIPFYGCFHLHGRGGGAKCENKCRFYYSLRPVPFYERYTEWRLREREEKNDSKGFGHDFSERFYDSLLVCQLSGDIDCYHGRVESRT